jgi:polyhydroxyalkanoate synthesis regulator phasin
MKDTIERSVLAGIGLLSLTRDKAQKYVDELVFSGEAKREDATELVDRLTKRGEDERASMRTLVRDEVSKVMGEIGIATTKDVQDLKNKIDAMKGEEAE